MGPNGRKMTLIRTLMGILRPTAGTVRILGRTVSESGEVRQQGYVPMVGFVPVFPREEMLQLCSRLYRHWDWKRKRSCWSGFSFPNR